MFGVFGCMRLLIMISILLMVTEGNIKIYIWYCVECIWIDIEKVFYGIYVINFGFFFLCYLLLLCLLVFKVKVIDF